MKKEKIRLKNIQDALDFADAIINTVREPLIVLDGDFKVVSVSRSFCQTFKVKAEESEGRFIYDLGNRQWDIPELRSLLEDIIPKSANFDNFEVEHNFPAIGRRIMALNARRIPRPPAKPRVILLAIEDITERKNVGKKLMNKMRGLETYKHASVGRELMMVALKTKIEELIVKIEELEAELKKIHSDKLEADR